MMEKVAVAMANLELTQVHKEYSIPHEAQWRWIRESLTKVAGNRVFGLDVQLPLIVRHQLGRIPFRTIQER